jgi:hypothetical protein
MIPVEETLYVFNAWTLMIDAGVANALHSGRHVKLFNSTGVQIGEGFVGNSWRRETLEFSR